MASTTENKNTIEKSLQDMITAYHNPDLVQPNASPNGNRIYHIYSDGEITHKKGGFAYLIFSEFSEKSPVRGFKGDAVFPKQGPTRSYAIVTEEHANFIREEMIREMIRETIKPLL